MMESIAFINLHAKWLSDRMSEGVIVSMLGNSLDEGMFGQVRKIFMMMVTWKREREMASWDVESFSSKCNECMINSPIAMHYHCSVIDILNSWNESTKRFELEQDIKEPMFL